MVKELNGYEKIPETFNLIGIRSIISPKLLEALASSGMGDKIGFVDSTYPVTSSDEKIIRLDGIPLVPLVTEVMKLWQLHSQGPIFVMLNDNNEVNKKCLILIVTLQMLQMTQTLESLLEIIKNIEKVYGNDIQNRNIIQLKMDQFQSREDEYKYIVVTGEPGPWNCIALR